MVNHETQNMVTSYSLLRVRLIKRPSDLFSVLPADEFLGVHCEQQDTYVLTLSTALHSVLHFVQHFIAKDT